MLSLNRAEWAGDYPKTVGAPDTTWGTFMVVYAWFLGLQVLDLGSTLAVIQHGGVEANPFGPVQAVDLVGQQALLGLKLVLVIMTMLMWLPAVAWLHKERATQSARIVNGLILAGTLVYTGVVVWNLAVLRILLG